MYFGKDRDIATIKRDDLLEFRNTLFKLPPKISQNNLYKGKSLDEIITLAKDSPKLSSTTIKKYLIRVNEFFNYCVDSEYILKSPSTNIQIKAKNNDAIDKKPYSDSEVSQILTFTKRLQEIGTNSKRVSKDDVYLITLIAAYSGMRLNEIVQLSTDDIRDIDGIVCFDINTNTDSTGKKKSVKTKNSIRVVSIYSKILELGFLKLLDARKEQARQKGKAVKIFFANNKDFSEYFRKHINTKIIDKNDKTKTFHSFRHTFINKLIQSDKKAEHIASLVGHEQQYKMTMNVYGQRLGVGLLKELVETIGYGI